MWLDLGGDGSHPVVCKKANNNGTGIIDPKSSPSLHGSASMTLGDQPWLGSCLMQAVELSVGARSSLITSLE